MNSQSFSHGFDGRRWLSWAVLAVVLSLGAGCSTSFQYTPAYWSSYPTLVARTGLAIGTGQDLRPPAERRPDWAADAEGIVARSLAAELSHAELFQRVKIHADAADPKKYSEVVRFRIEKFECYDQSGLLEQMGRDFLRDKGLPGSLSAASIPSRYVCDVTIAFEVRSAATQQSIFTQTYSASRTVTMNGYQSKDLQIKATSDALADVLSRFVADLARQR